MLCRVGFALHALTTDHAQARFTKQRPYSPAAWRRPSPRPRAPPARPRPPPLARPDALPPLGSLQAGSEAANPSSADSGGNIDSLPFDDFMPWEEQLLFS